MQERWWAPAVKSSHRERSRTVYINGKFYSGALNGVHRVADRLIRELDYLAGSGACPTLEFRLLLPLRETWAPAFSNVRKVPQRFGHHQAWEQFILPFRAADGALVNLANLAPLAHGRKLSMIHDAQFFISPESYRLSFSLGYRVLTPLIGATSERVLTVSEYARDSLASFKVSPHRKTEVIYNGADHILETPADATVLERLDLERGTYALLFGTPAIYKNIQVIFAAFEPGRTDLRLLILGDRAALRAAGLRPPEDALYSGKTNDGELRALYEGAACFLFPSRTEGFGLPPVEAMLCGCPVVAAPAGAIPEVCRDAVLYADIFSPDAWVEQIRALAADAQLRRAKVDAGRRRASQFTWRKAGLRLLGEIRRIAEGPVPSDGRRDQESDGRAFEG